MGEGCRVCCNECHEHRRKDAVKRKRGAGWRKKAPVVFESEISVFRVRHLIDAMTLPPGEQAFSAGAEKAQKAQKQQESRAREQEQSKSRCQTGKNW